MSNNFTQHGENEDETNFIAADKICGKVEDNYRRKLSAENK